MNKLLKIMWLCLFSLFLPLTGFATNTAQTDVATFAGGCFWCMQADFDKVSGVLKTYVGYTGGHVKNPTYKQVSHEHTGHYEAIEIIYNPKEINYKQLLNVFWHNIDPTNAAGQFCDYGSSYRAAIFYQNNKQKQLAIASKKAVIDSGRFKQVVTQILPAKKFYLAEQYHQKYYKKNPIRYYYYRKTCGRDARLRALWG